MNDGVLFALGFLVSVVTFTGIVYTVIEMRKFPDPD